MGNNSPMPQSPNPAPGFARNPDRTITVEPIPVRVTVTAGGATLAASANAKLLCEEGYQPVAYIPFADIAFAELTRTDTATHCPYKGDATYWRLAADKNSGDVMWAYEHPFDEMLEIRDHGAFRADRVSVEAQ